MSINHATLHQMKIFDAVARHMSFARAAEELHLTPPALSIQVKQLAEVIGQPLFEQIGKKISLTPAGNASWATCRDVLHRLEQLAQELAALQGLKKGNLKIATLANVKYFIPRILGEFCIKYPGVDTALYMGNREDLLERLARNQDDLYILGQPPEHLHVISEPFADNHLVVIASPQHPLAKEKNISPASFKDIPFILREPGSGTRLAAENFFESHGIKLKARMELGSNEAVKQIVAGGLGVAVLSSSTLRAELSSGEIVILDVKGFPLNRKWYMVYPVGKHLTPASKVFMEYLLAANPIYQYHPSKLHPKMHTTSATRKKKKL